MYPVISNIEFSPPAGVGLFSSLKQTSNQRVYREDFGTDEINQRDVKFIIAIVNTRGLTNDLPDFWERVLHS